MHLSVVLGYLDLATSLAFDKEKRQFELLTLWAWLSALSDFVLGVASLSVFHVIIPLLELGNGHLLLDQLKE